MAMNIEKLELKVEQRDAEAQYNLGLMYYKGQGVPQNYEQAAYLFKKAAKQGHRNAQDKLGGMYYNGKGVPQDDKKAIGWWRKSSAK